MDWNNFINDCKEKYNINYDDFEPFRKCAIITFNYDDKGNVSGTYHGSIVYRHTGSENTILPGDTWICSLSLNKNLDKNNYFAKPIEKIDASFFFALLAEDKDKIVEIIWENYQDTVLPLLEEKFKNIINERIKDAEIKVSNEKETIITELNDANAMLEKKHTEDTKIIESLQLQIEGLKSRETVVKQNTLQDSKITNEELNQYQGLTLFQEPKFIVNRTGPDTISSDYFKKSRYFVHLSVDQRMMIVHPSDKGNVVCINNTIELAGLSFVSNYVEPCEMSSKYNSKYGGIQIYLK